MGVSKLFVSEALILKKDLYDSRSPKLFVDFFIFHMMRKKNEFAKKVIFPEKTENKEKTNGHLALNKTRMQKKTSPKKNNLLISRVFL